MPKLYEYMGLVILFYANEHEPIHVHGKCQGKYCPCRMGWRLPHPPGFRRWQQPDGRFFAFPRPLHPSRHPRFPAA
ncbi:MAG: DUF4160 domain-containing protein [Gammaproteobacteria bacterium]|nr:DUF4160 domain-containing protein [Gammaproteobacteria bacterium]